MVKALTAQRAKRKESVWQQTDVHGLGAGAGWVWGWGVLEELVLVGTQRLL